jgi:hypothetical protein
MLNPVAQGEVIRRTVAAGQTSDALSK